MMCAIKIDPSNRTIEEIELAVDPNRSLTELRSFIGCDQLVLTPLDRGINLLSGEDDKTKPSFGFYGLSDLELYGVAVVVGGSKKRLRPLHEGMRSFELTVEWHA